MSSVQTISENDADRLALIIHIEPTWNDFAKRPAVPQRHCRIKRNLPQRLKCASSRREGQVQHRSSLHTPICNTDVNETRGGKIGNCSPRPGERVPGSFG